MNHEKMQAHELQQTSGLKPWLENFWYHYKWQTILVAFLLFTVIVCTAQCVSETPTDMTVTYAGNFMFSDAEQKGFNNVLSDTCTHDVDGNGDSAVALGSFAIYDEEQLTELYTYVDPETGETKVDKSSMMAAKQYNTERIQTLRTYVMTGDCAVWFVSPYVYETMLEGKVRVTEKVALKDTALYRSFDAVKALPGDTVVVLIYPTLGAYSKSDAYALAEEYFRTIVGTN